MHSTIRRQVNEYSIIPSWVAYSSIWYEDVTFKVVTSRVLVGGA